MAIDFYDPDRHLARRGWLARSPAMHTRAAMLKPSPPPDADGNAHVFAFGMVLIALWCVAASLILENGWNF
jgi:hypothetical protein